MTEDKEGRTETLSMLLIVIIAIIIISALCTTEAQQIAIQRPLFYLPTLDQSWSAFARY